jgi:hypothetical protein
MSYQVDVVALHVGCKCGFLRSKHSNEALLPQRNRSNIATTASATIIGAGSVEVDSVDVGPCLSYQVDVLAAQFGGCKCGHAKMAHTDGARGAGTVA